MLRAGAVLHCRSAEFEVHGTRGRLHLLRVRSAAHVRDVHGGYSVTDT